MLFTAPSFLFGFLPIIVVGSVLIGLFKNEKLSIFYLIIGSLIFYGWWNFKLLPLLLFSVLLNFFIGQFLIKNRSKSLLVFGVLSNLALIAVFKYLDFSIETFNFLFSTGLSTLNIALPLAISFFTFQQIAYLSDVYSGKVSDQSFLKYTLFVTFFPQLIAGPIVHHSEIIPQFKKPQLFELNLHNIGIGMEIFTIGLFKKLFIADGIARYSDQIFGAAASGTSLSFFDAWGGTLAYTIQIYFDFSGYSDMAIGLAWIFGIKLPLNFASPYKASSIVDFWQRWHITLSRFLRDYLYIPLGGNRNGTGQRYTNILITMVLGGLWHGAAWTFVAWGLLHAIFIIINQSWRCLLIDQRWLSIQSFWLYKSFSWLLTFWCITTGWIFFRADTFESGMLIFKGTLGLTGVSLPDSIKSGPLENFMNNGSELLVHGDAFLWIFLFICILVFAPNTQQIMKPWNQRFNVGNLGINRPSFSDKLRQVTLICFSVSTLIVGSLVINARENNMGNFIYMVF